MYIYTHTQKLNIDIYICLYSANIYLFTIKYVLGLIENL